MDFTKKFFSALADGCDIKLVDCSTDLSPLCTSVVYTFEVKTKYLFFKILTPRAELPETQKISLEIVIYYLCLIEA